MGFGNLVRQRGKETYKLKLTNRNYKYYNGLESAKQVVGPVSAQALVDWRLGECGDNFIGVCTEANGVMGAEAREYVQCLYTGSPPPFPHPSRTIF
jgi:hypothetical protein